MTASESLHPDLFGGMGKHPPVGDYRATNIMGPVHGPAEPAQHGPPKPRVTPHTSAGVRRKAFAFGQSEPTQLAMFMGARDIKDTINASHDTSLISEHGSHYGISSSGSDDSYYAGEEETLDDMWGRKLAESKKSPDTGVHGSGVHESIMKEGWRPHASITLNYTRDDEWGGDDVRIHDAHHRVAAAADIEEQSQKIPMKPRNIWIQTHHESMDY